MLESRGFSDLSDELKIRGRNSTEQIITGLDPGQKRFKARVRLCWSRQADDGREARYSAAQLSSGLTRGTWDATLSYLVQRDLKQGISHNLFVQDDPDGFAMAALVPSGDLQRIWEAQRRTSDELIAGGLTGGLTKNHAMNGQSPTIYLQDDRTPHTHRVADVLWAWPGVTNVLSFSVEEAEAGDSFDDLAGVIEIGRDEGERIFQVRSGYPRDAKVRRAVLDRAQGKCERPGCGQSRGFRGFLDVHHILGVWASDRPWSCVALCPNCHREAHFSPDRDRLNRELEMFAGRYGEVGVKSG
ncbi:MAG: hypothetical protein ACHP7A_03670 [Caulobacterales bacterium]